MKRHIILVILAIVLLTACASTLNVLDDVRYGQSEVQAIESVRATPTWVF